MMQVPILNVFPHTTLTDDHAGTFEPSTTGFMDTVKSIIARALMAYVADGPKVQYEAQA
jgi:hypothetical protein